MALVIQPSSTVKEVIPALDDMTRKFQIATIATGYFFDDLKTLNDYIFDVFTVNIENDWKPAMLGMRVSFKLTKKAIAEGLGDLLEKWGANEAEVASFKWTLENELLPTFDDVATATQNFFDKLDLLGKFFLQTWPQVINNWKIGMEDIKKGWEDLNKAFNKSVALDGLKFLQQRVDNPISSGFTKFVIENVDVPKHAKGGVITSPQLAMIGERGSEVVMPLEQNTGWIDMLANKLASIIATRNTTNRSGMAEDRPVEIVLQLGDAKFGKAVIQSINRLQQQTGKLMLDL
ncbi:MAG: hypothetical protein IJ062_11615 [Firmicutes bacterium]|nr:hypothetical protein [Bacillota bacterium]